MSRKKHIDTRNLVVCNTFDEFTNKLEQIDPNVEDIVGYITSLSRIIYGLTVESLWGILGFTWDSTSILEGVPYNEERIEHIEADGENIDYSQKDAEWKITHAVTKGYGHFNATTIPFTLIPTIPDGYRITEFRNTFNLIESDYIEVQRSDWSNLVDINYLADVGKSISIDITGANLNNNNKVIINIRGGRYYDANIRYTVYIKGDLINCTNGIFEYNNGEWSERHTILLDNDNKGLNLPMSLATSNVFYYTDEEKTFDIADWIYKNTDSPVNLQYNLYAASGKYHIDNALTNKIWNGTNSALRIFSYATSKIRPQDFTGVVRIVDPIAEEIIPLDITVDCIEDGIVREDRLCGLTVGPGNFDHSNGIYNNIYTYDTQVFEPMKYIGTPTSITMWNPYVIVKDDNSWPIYNQSIVDKLTKFDAGTTDTIIGNNVYGLGQGYFMYGAYLYITKPSPYTIDCTNIRYLNLFDRAKFLISEYSDSFRDIGGNKKALEIVKLTNANNLVSFKIGSSFTTNKPFYFTIPSLKTIFFGTENRARDRNVSIFIPKETTIELSYISYLWGDFIYIEDFSHVAFRYKYVDCRNYGLVESMNCANFGYGVAEIEASTEPINLFAFDTEILQDDNYLKASTCNTFGSALGGAFGNRVIIHPLIATNLNGHSYAGSVTYNNKEIHIQSDFIYVYNSNISLVNYRNFSNWQQPFNEFLTKILPNIKENDIQGNVCVISLSTPMYNAIMYDAQYATYKATILALNYSIADSGN